MLPILTLILFSFAAGIFATLSALERKLYPLMLNRVVPEKEIRSVQQILASVVNILPPTMMVVLFGSGILILVQIFTGDLGEMTWLIAGIYAAFLIVIFQRLFPTIAAVKTTDPINGPIEEVRPLTRETIIIHHIGFALSVVMMLLYAVAIRVHSA